MILVEEGHIVHAVSMRNETFHLAWGDLGSIDPNDPARYRDPWTIDVDPPESASVLVVDEPVFRSAAGWIDNLTNTSVINLVEVKSDLGPTPTIYIKNTDFIHVPPNGLNWQSGIHKPLAESTYYVTYRKTEFNLTGLVHELGRRLATIVAYAQPDVNGDITANGQKWSITSQETRYLYLQFKFDGDDAFNNTIYQLGIFINSVIAPGVPSGKFYLVPGELSDNGLLYMAENIKPFPRAIGKREIFEYITAY
jgi:hypothetical protein